MTKTPRPAGSRNYPVKSDIVSAFEDGRSDVECLKDEMSEWRDNMQSANMENVPKYDEVDEAANNLESADDALQGIDVPEHLQGLEVSFTIDTRRSATSRSARMQNALAALYAAKEGAEAWLDENEELEVTDPEDLGEDEEPITQEMADKREAQREATEEFVSELENAISEAEGVDFPGMY